MALPRQGQRQPIDRLAQLNDPADAFRAPETLLFMRTLVDIIRRMAAETTYRDTPSPHLLLRSPNGGIWQVTVSDTGVLGTTQVG